MKTSRLQKIHLKKKKKTKLKTQFKKKLRKIELDVKIGNIYINKKIEIVYSIKKINGLGWNHRTINLWTIKKINSKWPIYRIQKCGNFAIKCFALKKNLTI